MRPTPIIENEFIIFELINGILLATFKPGAVIDLAAAQQVVRDRLIMAADGTLPTLVDVRGLKSVTKEARDFLSSEQGQQGIKASAMVIAGYLSSTIANFFLKVNVKKNKFPVKTFSDRAKAVAWLEQYK